MKITALALSILTLFSSMPVFSLELPDADKEYFIAAGDVVNINVLPAEEFSKEVTVQPDGNIEIPLLGSIKAQGLRADELQKILTAKFSKYVANPTITITLRKLSASRVAIIGQMNGTGFFEYHEGMRLLELVALAGGPMDNAKMSKVRIFRSVKGPGDRLSQEIVKADLQSVFNGKMDSNIQLLSGDVVFVPRKSFYTATKWINEAFMPWATLLMFVLTVNLATKKS